LALNGVETPIHRSEQAPDVLQCWVFAAHRDEKAST
jgi:hypothetical protein